jgi:hypothetical protein
MKSLSSITFIAISSLALGETKTQPQPRYRDVVTHDRLAKALQKSQQKDPMKDLEQATGEDPSKVNQPINLLEQSDIVCFGGLATLVPKRAILATPNNHKDRLSIQPGVRVVGWSEFFAANRGWITTVEVTRIQAEGREPINEETRERIGKSRNLIVATFMGGPISVLPLKEAEKTQTTSVKP